MAAGTKDTSAKSTAKPRKPSAPKSVAAKASAATAAAKPAAVKQAVAKAAAPVVAAVTKPTPPSKPADAAPKAPAKRAAARRPAAKTGAGTGTMLGVAAAGLAAGLVANLGRKAAVQAPSVLAGDWFEALKGEHKAALGLLDQIAKTTDKQTAKRSMLLMQLKHALGKHAFTEENVIYPALREWGDKADADALNHEQGYHKQYLYELDGMDKGSPEFLVKCADFRADLNAHINEEEEKIFPQIPRRAERRQEQGADRAGEQGRVQAGVKGAGWSDRRPTPFVLSEVEGRAASVAACNTHFDCAQCERILGRAPARLTSSSTIGVAPGAPHLANLPLASLQRVAAGAAAGGHLVNLPLASLQGAASAGDAASDRRAAAVISVRIMLVSSPRESRAGRSNRKTGAGQHFLLPRRKRGPPPSLTRPAQEGPSPAALATSQLEDGPLPAQGRRWLGQRGVGAHQRGEEALVCATEVGEGTRPRNARLPLPMSEFVPAGLQSISRFQDVSRRRLIGTVTTYRA